MNLTLHPARRLSGTVDVPGDKSLSHRAALFAALADGESVIGNFLVSGVTRAMLDALTALGVAWRLDGTRLTVTGHGLRGWSTPATAVDCRNSATTFRLLAGAIAASGVGATLDGSAGLRRRPMVRIVEPLRSMGVEITSGDGTYAPLTLAARAQSHALRAASFTLPVASAQVKSCLILAALAADAPVTINEPGPSRDHTERMLAAMGAHLDVAADRHAVTVHPLDTPLNPLRIELPGDFSAAAFLIVAALIVPDAEVVIRHVGLNATRTGLLDALRAMGGSITVERAHIVSGELAGDLRVRGSALHGTAVAGDLVVRMIDEFPAFAVAAAFAQGETTVRDATELRHKESDRIAQQCAELRKLGVDVTEADDGFSLQGGRVRGGTVVSHGDHRTAMSLAVAGLAADGPVTVQGAEIADESFPGFAAALRAIGAVVVQEPLTNDNAPP
jgi:3-phosphoshikimate 1-carboxyvinyltransferase